MLTPVGGAGEAAVPVEGACEGSSACGRSIFTLRKVGEVFSRRCTRESCSAMVGCRRVHVDEGERGWAGAVDVVDAAGASILGWSVASLLVICCNGPDNIVTGYAK